MIEAKLVSLMGIGLDGNGVVKMPTDYLLFNHGVSTRDARPQPQYADSLYRLIQSHYKLPGRTLQKIELYWGDVNEVEEQNLSDLYQASSLWPHLWFRDWREMQLLQFVGDAVLYISRAVGYKVADRLREQVMAGLHGCNAEEDRLHVVTHSMGTVILFDILFSARWDPSDVPGHASVEEMRDGLFGVAPNQGHGIRLGSIAMMGSPIGFFSLLSVTASTHNGDGQPLSGHDITPRLELFLKSLYQELGTKLPWYNFVHPGDPIGCPLEKLLPCLLDGASQSIDIQDILTPPTGLDVAVEPVSQTMLALAQAGVAHGSYWQSDLVAQKIAQAIEKAV
jgi:hypothetical protein